MFGMWLRQHKKKNENFEKNAEIAAANENFIAAV